MRMRAVEQAKHAAASHCTRVPSGLLQRKCACGATPGADGRCADCRNERVPRSATQPEGPAQIPSVVHEVLRAPGEPLDAETRRSMEARFGRVSEHGEDFHAPIAAAPLTISPAADPLERRADNVAAQAMRPQSADGHAPRWDFSRVRVHADTRAAQSAQVLNALAYTVGESIVFGSGRFAPRGHEGQHLLAHELAHTLQAQGARIARQPDPAKVLSRPHRPTLPPYKPAPPPAPRRADVPAGVAPCLTGKICEPPVPGSAWDFGKRAEKQSTARPKTPTPAKEVKRAANESSPGILKDIFEVTVNPGLSESVAAQVDTCKEFNVAAAGASASCIEVPKALEEEAARFNQGLMCVDEAKGADPLACLDRDHWQYRLISVMTHEVAHVTFRHPTPAGISSRTRNEITLHEVSELYAQLSEFPVHYRRTASIVSLYGDKQKAREVFHTSIDAWIKIHVESSGEGIRGMLTKLRCINTCGTVTVLVTSLVQSVTAAWPEEMKNLLLQGLHDVDKLDWPMPAPISFPAPTHPKMPPLYQPRGTFIPEIEKSIENLP